MSLESDLLTRALELPDADRAELASRLLLSLEPDDFDADTEAEWASEIERRRLALDRGETMATPWREAMDRIQQGLRPGAAE
jgi:putative addiction module component (TIGR02574 family)